MVKDIKLIDYGQGDKAHNPLSNTGTSARRQLATTKARGLQEHPGQQIQTEFLAKTGTANLVAAAAWRFNPQPCPVRKRI